MATIFFTYLENLNETEKILLNVLKSVNAAKAEIAYPLQDSPDCSHWEIECRDSGGFIARGAFNGFTGKRLRLGKNSTIWLEGSVRCVGDYEYDSSEVRELMKVLDNVKDGSGKKRNMDQLNSLLLSAIREEQEDY